MRGWSKLTERLGVWYYPGTWYAAPVQSCTVFNLIDDFRFFKDSVKRFQFIEKFIVFILGQFLSALNPQSGEFVPDISGLSGII